MAADSPYKTLANIRSAIIKDSKETTASAFVSLVDRWINEGHEQVTLRKKRDWLDKKFTVQVNAATDESGVTVTNNSTSVTFPSGSTFPPSTVERKFYAKGFSEVYDVTSINTSTLVVTLSNAYMGDSSTSANGVVFQSSINVDSDVRHIYNLYHGFNSQTVEEVGPQQMREIEARGPTLDYASYWSVFGLNSSSSYVRRLVIYPYPLEAYTLYMDCNIYVPVLSATTDEPLIPMQYRQILYWYGMYKVWLYHRNEAQAATALANFNSMLAKIDGEMRAEIEFPQISVSYPRRATIRRVTPPFDPRERE